MFVADHHRAWYTVRGIFRPIADVVLFIVAACAARLRKRKERIALAWPSVEGCVQSGRLASPPDKTGRCSVALEYSYFVGEYRSGEYTECFDSDDDAREFIRAMEKRRVQIHYNPSKPDDSVFEPTDAEQTYITTPLDPVAEVTRASW